MIIDDTIDENCLAHDMGEIEMLEEEFKDLLWHEYSLCNAQGKPHPMAVEFYITLKEKNSCYHDILCEFEENINVLRDLIKRCEEWHNDDRMA